MASRSLERLVRWIARLWSVASLVFLSAFILGEAEPRSWPTAAEWIGLACFPLGVGVGLVVAWWKERLGGVITLASLIGFYVWHLAVAGRFATGPWFALVAAPGLLFVVAAWLKRQRHDAGAVACAARTVSSPAERPNR
jgi:hypothetical protein